MDINSVGRVIFHSVTQVAVASFVGATLEYLFAQSAADFTKIDNPQDALLASVEVLGQISLSCVGAGIIYNKLLKMPPDRSDPAQGIGFVFGLFYSQLRLAYKLGMLIKYFKGLVEGLGTPAAAPATATTMPAQTVTTTQAQANQRGLPPVSV
jgi:hypothetical protein